MTFFIFAAGSARYRRGRFFLLLYIAHRLSIHYSQSKPRALTPPPCPPSTPSPQPAPRSDVEFKITLFQSQQAAPPALFVHVRDPQAPCPARLELDIRSDCWSPPGVSGREPVDHFTLHVSHTLASQGIVPQASAGLHLTSHLC